MMDEGAPDTAPGSATRSTLVTGIAAGLVATVLFAGGAVVSRFLVAAGHAPADLTLVRYLGCFPVAVVALALMRERLRLELSWSRFLTLMAVGGPPYHVLLLTGYGHATSGAGALLVVGLVPVLGLLVARVAVGEVPTARAVIGAVLVVAGLAVFGGASAFASFTPTGFVVFSSAALSWAILNHLVRVWDVDPLRLTFALALWAPVFLPFYFLSGHDPFALTVSAELSLQFVYHGVLVAIAATVLFFVAVRDAGVHRAGALLALVPPIAASLGSLFLGERVSVPEIAGTIIAVVGIAIASSRNVPPRQQRAATKNGPQSRPVSSSSEFAGLSGQQPSCTS